MLQFFLLMIIPFVYGNEVIKAKIHDVDFGDRKKDETLVFLSTGQVVKIPPRDPQLNSLKLNKLNEDQWFEIKIDKKRFIQRIKSVKKPSDPEFHFYKSLQNTTYVPTTIKSFSKASALHRKGRRNPKESQCFNRAMVWSYEWWKEDQIKSMKIFIFFTRNYIRKFNFDWWFHIAPYVHVYDGNKITEKVMDLKYTSKPTSFRQWSNIFMHNNSECSFITKYSEYADYPYHGDCFFMRTHMFTYQPADLQMYEAWGYSKDQFNLSEVNGAYKEAFDLNLGLEGGENEI